MNNVHHGIIWKRYCLHVWRRAYSDVCVDCTHERWFSCEISIDTARLCPIAMLSIITHFVTLRIIHTHTHTNTRACTYSHKFLLLNQSIYAFHSLLLHSLWVVVLRERWTLQKFLDEVFKKSSWAFTDFLQAIAFLSMKSYESVGSKFSLSEFSNDKKLFWSTPRTIAAHIHHHLNMYLIMTFYSLAHEHTHCINKNMFMRIHTHSLSLSLSYILSLLFIHSRFSSINE